VEPYNMARKHEGTKSGLTEFGTEIVERA